MFFWSFMHPGVDTAKSWLQYWMKLLYHMKVILMLSSQSLMQPQTTSQVILSKSRDIQRSTLGQLVETWCSTTGIGLKKTSLTSLKRTGIKLPLPSKSLEKMSFKRKYYSCFIQPSVPIFGHWVY
uniref:Uncharacterized protein n=1 Tax=Rhizophora mucronata TaxID=61149 RepID=A0A2P2LS90_RHIMU